MAKEIYTVGDIERATGYDGGTIRRWLDNGNIGRKMGRQWALTREEYDAVLAKAAALSKARATGNSKTRSRFNQPVGKAAIGAKSGAGGDFGIEPLLSDPKQRDGSKLRKFDPVAFMRNGGWQSNEAGVL